MTVMANYMSRFSFFYYAPHLKGEGVFGSTKQPVDCSLSVDNGYHHLDRVNLFRPQIIIFASQPNVVKNVGVQQLPCSSSACSLWYFEVA
jgi:hypothetical protein